MSLAEVEQILHASPGDHGTGAPIKSLNTTDPMSKEWLGEHVGIVVHLDADNKVTRKVIFSIARVNRTRLQEFRIWLDNLIRSEE